MLLLQKAFLRFRAKLKDPVPDLSPILQQNNQTLEGSLSAISTLLIAAAARSVLFSREEGNGGCPQRRQDKDAVNEKG